MASEAIGGGLGTLTLQTVNWRETLGYEITSMNISSYYNYILTHTDPAEDAGHKLRHRFSRVMMHGHWQVHDTWSPTTQNTFLCVDYSFCLDSVIHTCVAVKGSNWWDAVTQRL